MPKKLSATTMLLLAAGAFLAYRWWTARQASNATLAGSSAAPLVP